MRALLNYRLLHRNILSLMNCAKDNYVQLKSHRYKRIINVHVICKLKSFINSFARSWYWLSDVRLYYYYESMWMYIKGIIHFIYFVLLCWHIRTNKWIFRCSLLSETNNSEVIRRIKSLSSKICFDLLWFFCPKTLYRAYVLIPRYP